MQIAVFGDIHGCFNSFYKLINQIDKKYKIDKYYFVGDLIDRGPSTFEVLNFLINNVSKGEYVLGNHEDLMIDYIDNTERYSYGVWFENGGLETIKSFIKEDSLTNNYFNDEFIKYRLTNKFYRYIEFIKSFKEYITLYMGKNKFLISHGGVYDFKKKLDEQYEGLPEKLKKQKYPFVWSRNTDFEREPYFDYIIIHGHTPIRSLGLSDNFNEPYINKSGDKIISINIDTGCVYGYSLTALIIDDSGEFTFEKVSSEY
ncbi:MAG: metallophosphoesterase [Deferribacterota bacterium]|nr:metallophosphoesterase [Deferribacterota bacterium]